MNETWAVENKEGEGECDVDVDRIVLGNKDNRKTLKEALTGTGNGERGAVKGVIRYFK